MRELILYQDDDGEWVAETEEIPGLRVKGKTEKEAIERIQTALKLYTPCRCDH